MSEGHWSHANVDGIYTPPEPDTLTEGRALTAEEAERLRDTLLVAANPADMAHRLVAFINGLLAERAARAEPGLREALTTLRTAMRTDPADRFWEGWDAALMAVEVATFPGPDRAPAARAALSGSTAPLDDGLCGECGHDDNEHVHYCSHDEATGACDCNAVYARLAATPAHLGAADGEPTP